MMGRRTWACMVLLSGGLFLFQSGCAEQKPKSGGNTSVDPALNLKPGVPPTTPEKAADPAKAATPEDKTPVEKSAPADTETPPKTPADAGSTTGGGTETPATPGDGQ